MSTPGSSALDRSRRLGFRVALEKSDFVHVLNQVPSKIEAVPDGTVVRVCEQDQCAYIASIVYSIYPNGSPSKR